MTRSKPFMCYLDNEQYQRLRKFASKSKLSMTQVIREGVDVRIAKGNPYVQGFNDGLAKAINLVEANKASQMRFPSGKSFGDLISEEIKVNFLKESNEEGKDAAEAPSAGGHEGGSGTESQGDQGLGC